MPTTTWPVMRADIMRPLGLVEANTDTNLTTNTSVQSDELKESYDVDDTFNGWWIEILNDTDGSTSANVGKVRRITDYTASSGTLTVSGGNLVADDEDVNFVLMRFNPTRVREYFNRARLAPELYHITSIVRDIQTLVTGQNQHLFTLPSTVSSKPIRVMLGSRETAESTAENEITDPSFEDWSSTTALSSWTVTGSGGAVNQEEETTNPKNYQVLEGRYSARFVGRSGGETTLLQTVTPSVGTQSVEANFSVWVYNTQTAVNVTARCIGTDSSAHGGTGWERLTVSTNVGEATTVSVGVAVAAGTAFSVYVDEAVLVMGQSEVIEPPWEPLLNWRWTGPVAGASNGGLLEFPYDLPEKRRLRVIARDVISSVSGEASTVEVDSHRLEPLYAKTRAMLCGEAKLTGPADERTFWLSMERDFERDYQEAVRQAIPSGLPNPYVSPPDWGM